MYLIYTGNVYPHKNIPVLLKAVKMLPELKLIIVCGRSVFADRTNKLIRDMNLQNRVEFRHLVSDTELKKLYADAFCFVTPSLIEGFGLPGLEAMACGTPVIAANASCLPEIYGEAALFFNPKNPSDLVGKIKEIIFNKKLRQDLVERGYFQVKKYSWAKMAEATWQIYQDILR